MEGVKRGWSRLGTKEETGKEKIAGEVKRREKMREFRDRGEMCPGGYSLYSDDRDDRRIF